MRSLVILGANGYIGTRLVKALREKHSVKALVYGKKAAFAGDQKIKIWEGNILDRTTIEKMIGEGDTVICLAGTTTAAKDEKDHFEVNVVGQTVVASVCAEKKARAVYFSTSLLSASDLPVDAYSFSKRLGEEAYEFYARMRGLDAIIFRLGSVYGPGQEKGAVFTMARSLKDSGVIEIPKMKVVRDLIHIEDVIAAVERAIDYKRHGFHIFNVTGGKGVSLAELAEKILAAHDIDGRKGKVKKVKKMVRPAMVSAPTGRTEKELGFKPSMSLGEGLQRTLDSYKD